MRITKNKIALAPANLINKLTVTAILIAVSVALNYISIVILPNSLEITFYGLPLILIGCFYGPFFGALSGFAEDFLHYIINSHPFAYYPGFAASAALHGYIPGIIIGICFLLFSKIKKNKLTSLKLNKTASENKQALLIATGLFVILELILMASWIWLWNDFFTSKTADSLRHLFGQGWIAFIVCYFLIPNLLFFMWIYYFLLRGQKRNDLPLSLRGCFLLTSMLGTILISVILDTMWVVDNYKTSWELLLFIKTITTPIYICISYLFLELIVIRVRSVFPVGCLVNEFYEQQQERLATLAYSQ